ncbi:12302_t:CDS:2, partial [Gigaspora rosea]
STNKISLQPANAGYSYGVNISNTLTVLENVYIFLQIFFQEYPKYAKLVFHIVGESNSWVNPLAQSHYYPDMVCNSFYGSVLSDSTCSQMRLDYPQWYYTAKLVVLYIKTVINQYDIREQCRDNYYPGLDDAEKYSNREDVKNQLGVNSSLTFKRCID